MVLHFLAAGQDPYHRSFTTADGLPSNKVYRAIQDHEGFMWFATDNGVARFDGLEFTALGLEDGLVDTEIIMIQEDHEHRIWFMGLNGKLAYWKDGRVYNERSDTRLKGVHATSGWSTMAVDKEGAIWFGALSGELVRLDMVKGSHRFIGRSIMKRYVMQDARGAILSMTNGELHLHSGDTSFLIHTTEGTLHSTHVYPSERPGGDPLAMIDGRLYDIGSSGMRPLRNGPKLDPLVHRNALRTFSGDIWLHRHDRGVDRVEVMDEGYGPIKHFLQDRTVNMVYTDRSGHHWFCTASRGVVFMTKEQLRSTRWLTCTDVPDAVMTSLEAGVDRVWIGTDQGHILTYRNDSLRLLRTERTKAVAGRVLRILCDPDGTTWFGTDYSLVRWDPAKPRWLDNLVSYRSASSISAWTAVKAILRTQAGELLTGGIGVHRLEKRAGIIALHNRLDDSFLRFRVRSLGEDRRGRIWAGVHSGLLELNGDRAMVHTFPDSILSSEVIDMVALGMDTLLLATNGNGLILWSNGRTIRRIGQREGLPSLNIRRMRLYGDTVWCATASGVVAFILKGEQVIHTWKWTIDEGLPTNDMFDMVVHNGSLLMLSEEGLGISVLVPEEHNGSLGPVFVARIQVNDTDHFHPDGRTSILLKRGDHLRIDVHALEFARARAVEYAFSLDNSNEWHPCRYGQVSLNGTTDGKHLIAVRARLPNGPWSDATTLEFEVMPPWWARRWVTAMGGLLLILGVILMLWAFERGRYRKKLAAVTAQMALNEERRRIAADVHDDLGADLSRILLQLRRADMAPEDRDRRVSEGVLAAVNKIDEIIWSLDPKRDTLQGTLNFIEQYALELCETRGMAFRTSTALPEGEMTLTANERREVFLIAKEAMRNVMKHASATTLYLHAELNGEVVVISITDDGAGIGTVSPSAGRSGVSNMQERAARLGGTLIVTSIRPSGTRVELHFVPKNHPNG